jgi:hypothetical protein
VIRFHSQFLTRVNQRKKKEKSSCLFPSPFQFNKKKTSGINQYLRGVMDKGSSGAEMAGTVISFKLKEASSWWHDINESPFWQDRIFHVLAALYGLVAAVALVHSPHLPLLLLMSVLN